MVLYNLLVTKREEQLYEFEFKLADEVTQTDERILMKLIRRFLLIRYLLLSRK